MGWYGPVGVNVHTAQKGVCNSGVRTLSDPGMGQVEFGGVEKNWYLSREKLEWGRENCKNAEEKNY